MVDGAKTVENIDGDVALAFKRLREKSQLKTTPSYVRLNKQFVNTGLESKDHDPEVFLTELEAIVLRMNSCEIKGKSKKTDMDIILQAIAIF